MSSTKVEYHAESNENNVTLITNKRTDKDDAQTSAQATQPDNKAKQGRLPRLFERSSKKWWNPQMDSEILEKQCLNFVLEQSRWYFQLALVFIMVACISWMIYFGATRKKSWIIGLVWSAVLTLICVGTYIITEKTHLYKKFSSYIAVTIAALLIATVILAAFFNVMTSVGSFFLAAETILLLYTVMPLPLHINFALGIVFSIAYEILYHAGSGSDGSVIAGDVIAHILLHLCLHVIGVQICLNLQVRRRSTFWKVGQIINSNQSVEMERGFKKVMIDSIMPKIVSDTLMNDGQNIFRATSRNKFRPLYVERMENVSILYADIVGFTKMSSGKTAAELVFLLNDLFGRFDALCLKTGCEKISTLGDCYYCVAGCPVPKPDHAKCCVEMGLGMIKAIKDFCADNQLNVDMRIGIHTGIVICGVVGMKRFKFDVWSNDVSFANLMEQWGVPGRIHISEPTRECLSKLGDEYEIEDGRIEERVPKDVVESRNLKTYLIVKPLRENSDTSSMSGESSISSQEPSDEKNGKTPDKISIENEKPKTNGLKGDVKDGEGEVVDAHENPVAANPTNGTLDHETSQPNDPLLSVKQRPSHRHHHSSRARSRKQHESETKKNQDIFEFIGMLPFLDTAVREKQDKEFVNTIKDDPRMKNINNDSALEPLSMRFKDNVIEEAYRNKYETEVKNHEPITSFVCARFSFFLDLFISFIVFFLVFCASIAILPIQTTNVAWIVFFCIFFCLILFAISVSGTYVFNLENTPNWIKTLIIDFSGWVARHFIGAILLVCPAGIVFSNLWCHENAPTCAKHLILIGVVIVHFLNFNQLSSWIRSITASFVALTIILLVYVNPCSPGVNVTNNVTQSNVTVSICDPENGHYEFVLDILLLMLFIFIVNRQYEVGHRLTFYSAREASENKNKMEEEKEQIDQLLFHIIPPRVTEVIREKKMYSQNHENVAVIFASITNFNEFYEEQYAGGKECIRILNELIGDVDERLDQEKYAIVEKIKTIGATFMIASGLNPTNEADIVNHSHLVTLMEFCMEMQDVIYEFSQNMVYFKFILRIGFNHGSVTAGVIGTTKLLYDIWGDTVNIASRMDSTGLPGRIQVAEGSMECLKDKFEFEHRGSTYVKGKGQMETYLVKRPGDEEKFEVAQNVHVPEYVEYR